MAAAIEFHTGVADPLGFACRLLRKACRRGARVLVAAPEATLAALDRALWTFDERDFVPHLRLSAGAAPAALQRTPIWLFDAALPAPAPAVLVNLGADDLPDTAAFERVIEIVADDAESVAAGRRRWRAYKADGRDITHHVAAAAARE